MGHNVGQQDGGMRPEQRITPWLLLQLGLGLGWIAVLSAQASSQNSLSPGWQHLAWMLIWAGWLPTLPVALWQQHHRRWRALIGSDLIAAAGLLLLAWLAYLPLFWVNALWFVPLALMPRGVLSELILRVLKQLLSGTAN